MPKTTSRSKRSAGSRAGQAATVGGISIEQIPENETFEPTSDAPGPVVNSYPSTTANWLAKIKFSYVLLCLPALLILTAQTNPLFPPTGYIDTWVYFGFFRSFINFKRELFLGTYYGSRLSWILPGTIAHQIFSPLVAEIVLHLAVYFAAIGSLYYILATTIDRRVGLLGSLTFAFYPYVWAAVGWDYVDGAGIAYYLMTTALLTKAAVASRPSRSLIGSGAAFAATIYTNLAWGILAPALALHYLWLRRIGSRRELLLTSRDAVLWGGIGTAGVTAVLGGINYVADGNFWFYSPSIAVGYQFVGKVSPWFKPVIQEGQLVGWMWLPIIVIVAGSLSYGIAALKKHLKQYDVPLLYFLELAISFGFLVYAQAHGSSLLGLFFYASYLIPGIFLCVSALAWSKIQLAGTRALGTSIVALTGILVIPWWLSSSNSILHFAHSGITFIGVLACVLLIIAALAKTQRLSVAASIASFGVLYLAINVGRPDDAFALQAQYGRVMSVRENIEGIRDGGKIRWWYNDQDKFTNDFQAVSSTYLWGYTLLSTKFPDLPKETALQAPSLIAITSSLPDAADVAIRALTPFLKPKGLVAVTRRHDTIRDSRVNYTLVVLEVQEDTSQLKALTVSYEQGLGRPHLTVASNGTTTLPNSGWAMASYPGREGHMAQIPDGVDVLTPRLRQAYASMYPTLAAPVEGTYRFELTYKPVSGDFSFGMLSGDQSHWIASTANSMTRGPLRTKRFDIALKQGEPFRLLTSNLQPTDEPSHYVIAELRAFLVAK